MRILIVEDKGSLGRFLARALDAEDRQVTVAGDADEALRRFLEVEPDLLVLDLDLPFRSGMDVLRSVREASPLCPVLVLSGSADGSTRAACLDAGADDCLAMPFSQDEFRARCGALLRRHRAFREALRRAEAAASSRQTGVLRCGTLELDRINRRAEVDGSPVSLTNREFALLEQLMLAGGEILSRGALCGLVWEGKQVEANVVDVHVAALRRKLGSSAPAILTLRGAGFRMAAPSAPRSIAPLLYPQGPGAGARPAVSQWSMGEQAC